MQAGAGGRPTGPRPRSRTSGAADGRTRSEVGTKLDHLSRREADLGSECGARRGEKRSKIDGHRRAVAYCLHEQVELAALALVLAGEGPFDVLAAAAPDSRAGEVVQPGVASP